MGLRIASFIFLGGVVGFAILVPIYGLFNGFPDSTDVLTQIGVDDYKKVWEDQIRFAGVGAMVWRCLHSVVNAQNYR